MERGARSVAVERLKLQCETKKLEGRTDSHLPRQQTSASIPDGMYVYARKMLHPSVNIASRRSITLLYQSAAPATAVARRRHSCGFGSRTDLTLSVDDLNFMCSW